MAFLGFVVLFIVGILASEHPWLRVVLGCVLLAFAGCAFYLSWYVVNHAGGDANASGVGAIFLIAGAAGVIAALASIVMFAKALRSGD
jgi:hypothetical protein